MKENLEKYADIFYLKHHEPDKNKHPRMSIYNRAAQFAPFAALTGYEDKINEESRQTTKKIILDKEKQIELEKKINYLQKNKSTVIVTYFVQDNKKNGGKYVSHKGNVRQVVLTQKKIIFEDDCEVLFKDIYSIIIVSDNNMISKPDKDYQ